MVTAVVVEATDGAPDSGRVFAVESECFAP